MTGDPYQVHDLAISNGQKFSLNGQVTVYTKVVYYVGTHGPFEDDYDGASVDAATIKAGVDKRVQTLRLVGEAYTPPVS